MQVRFTVFIAISLDGFIARPDGGLDWLERFHDEEHGYGMFFDGVDAVVLGRGTYDTVLGFPAWPYGGKRVIVCTSRPARPAHGEELWSGPPRALAERLDREGFRRVYLDGGALIRSFLREGLVHELTIDVVPLVLGAGRPLFASGLPELPLRLQDARSFPSGLVQLRYARA
ncbi:MAG TPA: dihydrofolate reductase family protein [Myxococcaceae bacterium]|nr:dihydrofolate reductase family protein [Myxococcaceae bacterium]